MFDKRKGDVGGSLIKRYGDCGGILINKIVIMLGV